MNFRPELAAKVMAGEKTVTRRMASTNPRSPWFIDGCSLKPGRSYAVCPGRGKHAIGRVTVTDVRIEMLGCIAEDEARKEGFASSRRGRVSWKQVPETVGTHSVQTWNQPRGKANGGKQHSRKPEGALDLIERVAPGPYAELFARRARFGWDYPVGDQALGGVAA